MTHAIIVRSIGGPEALGWESIEVADPGPGEARVRQFASGLNYIDVYHRTGYYARPLPFVPGVEGAGTVEAVGPGVCNLQVGDRVAYAGPLGSYAEHRLVAADRLLKLPNSISFEQAAAMMLQGMTAQMLLRQIHPLQRGDAILVHAAAGGTGLMLCQWASALGATVIGTVSTEAKAALASANGCHHTILYTQQDFVTEVARITNHEKLAVVFDSVGGETFLQSLDCLRPRGWMVTFGQSSGPVAPIAPVLLAQKGSLFLTRPSIFDYIKTRQELQRSADELFAAVTSGIVRIHINQRFSLREAAHAHFALESRSTTGATVLVV
jgi:NADPH:quinone reductase